MNLALDLSSMPRSPLSLVDDVGTLYIGNDCMYRVIGIDKKQEALDLMGCGLIQELIDNGLFPHTEVAFDKCTDDKLVIKHRKIERTVYPFEWSPEMLRRAAICVLEVNDCARRYGYELKDVHPYNVMYENCTPMYIDFGSFIKSKSSKSWVAYGEFISCYVSILRLAANNYKSIFKHAFMLRGTGFDGSEAYAASSRVGAILGPALVKKISRALSYYRLGPLINIGTIRKKVKNKILCKIAEFFLHSEILPWRNLSSNALRKKINKFKLESSTFWADYHQSSGFYATDGSVKLSARLEWVSEKVKALEVESIIEFAGNQGVLSRGIAKIPRVRTVICSDYDENAIDALVDNGLIEKLYPACFDFMSDAKEGLSGERASRFKSDLVIALAVTHHLLLTQKYSIDSIIGTLAKYSSKYIIIEYMPLGLWDGKSAPILPGWYSESWFVDALSKEFTIIDRAHLEENRIVFVGERLKSPEYLASCQSIE